MIKVGEIVELNDNKKYMVLNKINLHNINYVYFTPSHFNRNDVNLMRHLFVLTSMSVGMV